MNGFLLVVHFLDYSFFSTSGVRISTSEGGTNHVFYFNNFFFRFFLA